MDFGGRGIYVISQKSKWSPRSVRRKIFFAISLAIPHLFLLPPDADLPQFAQKAGTLASSLSGRLSRFIPPVLLF
jgi:hypothetical protein